MNRLISFFLLLAPLVTFHSFAQPAASVIEKPVDDADYQRILEYYTYDKGMPCEPEFYGEWPWRGPHVLYKLSYSSVRGQRVPAYLAIPKDKTGEKLPVVILMHGWNLFWGKNEDWVLEWIPLLTGQGYAVLAPDHFMYGERKKEGGFDEGSDRGPYYYRDWMCQSIVDLERGIDYLESRSDIDPERIAIFGGSLGGWIGSILAAVDPRIKTAILSVPATETATAQTPAGRIINSSNFFPRYKDLSLLMVLAEHDDPLRNDRAKAFYDLVQVEKEMVMYDASHFLDPQQYNKEILEWLKKHL
jgi:dienelactone hydrolase